MANNVILKQGFANIEVVDVVIKDRNGEPLMSRKGDAMAKLQLHVTDTEGRFTTVYDYVLPTLESLKWKYHQIKRCFGVDDFYVGGQWIITPLMYKSGMGTVKTQEAQGEWGERSVIGSYMAAEDVDKLLRMPASGEKVQSAANAPAKTEHVKVDEVDLDDDVPF